MKKTLLFLPALAACASTAPAPTSGASAHLASTESLTSMSWVGPGDRAEDVAARQGVQVKVFDLNHDGRPDVYHFYTSEPSTQTPGVVIEHIVRKELDINQDGRFDVVRIYDKDKKDVIIEERDDLDFDGKPDEIIYFTDGAISRKELDLDFDGKPDVVKFYNNGHLVRIESDRNRRGKVDTWEYYENDVLDRIGMDTDGDGQVDTWQRQAAKDTPAGAPRK